MSEGFHVCNRSRRNCPVLVMSPEPKAKHLLACINGNTPVSAPKAYVKELFDNYASKFEYSLVENLQYNVPNELTQMIMTKQSVGSLGSVLDLGSGIGLAGVELKQFCCHVEDIDLSHSMIKQAQKKNIYDQLI